MRPRSDDVIVVCEGWAFEYLHWPQGRRQILRFLSAGDLLHPDSILSDAVATPARALTDIQLGIFPRAAIRERLAKYPQLAVAIAALLGERLRASNRFLTVVAQGSAEERIAWFLLHLAPRLRKRNADHTDSYSFPLLQQHIADSVGLTSVHVSRIMASFRARGWLRLEAGLLEISNREELAQVCRFNPESELTATGKQPS